MSSLGAGTTVTEKMGKYSQTRRTILRLGGTHGAHEASRQLSENKEAKGLNVRTEGQRDQRCLRRGLIKREPNGRLLKNQRCAAGKKPSSARKYTSPVPHHSTSELHVTFKRENGKR